MKLMLSEIVTAVGGTQQGDNVLVTGVSTDSRSIVRGEMFIALRGEHYDAHDFIEHAARRGAVCALVERACPSSVPLVVVDDTRAALARLAAWWRQRLGTRLVAITGSNGKTTVKEMTAAILTQSGEVLATRGNLNNEIGVPLTLLRLQTQHRFGVIEMGANHPREIAFLANLARPNVGVVTNAGPAHLEGFGDLDGVAAAKGELFQALGRGDVAVINIDDVYAGVWREMAGDADVLGFGLDDHADITATWEPVEGGSRVHMRTPLGAIDCTLAIPGEHNVRNALAATAAAVAMGARAEHIRTGLDGFSGVEGRLQIVSGLPGMRIIDDSYNANPASLQAALDVLSSMPGERWLALGDMGELGPDSQAIHERAAQMARCAGVARLYCLGPQTRHTAQSFGGQARHFDNAEALARQLAQDWKGEGVILVKGSRAMRMERVVALLGGHDKQNDNRQAGNGGGV